jgi:hypothetical protein
VCTGALKVKMNAFEQPALFRVEWWLLHYRIINGT